MRHFTAVIPGQPLPKGRPRIAGKRVMRTPKRTREYEKHAKTWLQHEAMKQGITEPFEGKVVLKAVFYRRTKTRVDIDNLQKALQDAVTKAGIWKDDSQVKRFHGDVEYDKSYPRTELSITDWVDPV